jgi:hypothetical protein
VAGVSLPTEEQFEKLQQYVSSCATELREIEDALEESVSEVCCVKKKTRIACVIFALSLRKRKAFCLSPSYSPKTCVCL